MEVPSSLTKTTGFEVVTTDLVGFGKSQYPPGAPAKEYTYERWAKDLNRIIQHYQLQDVSLVGYSMGGAVVVVHMMNYSGSVDRFVLIDAARPHIPHEEKKRLPLPDQANLDLTLVGIEQSLSSSIKLKNPQTLTPL
ncbi:MAG: alpha/beta fold hydrolase [Halobacteriota archaeon]